MKRLNWLFALFLVVPLLFTACKDDDNDDDVNTDYAKTLKDYLVQTDMDLDHVIKNASGAKFVAGAPDATGLQAFLDKYYIIDIRSATDYAGGHIEGAVQVDFTGILDEAAKASKPVLVVCYTGQTACYAASLLRLYGYHDAQALKWGMSGWHADYAGKWNSNIGNTADGHTNWTFDAAPANVKFTAPSFTTTATTGEDILKERVEYVVANGFKGVSGTDVIDNPSAYFINNYFSETDYNGFGHIKGSYRVLPLLIADESILNLDPDQKVITYCYTGQTSAVISAFLNVLGYDAYSLKFGVNGLWNDNPAWTSNQWGGDSNPKDLPTVQ